MDLFRLVLAADGGVLEKDKVALADLSPAMRAPFLGPFNGGSGEGQIPLGGGKVAVIRWDGSPALGTARGTFAVDDVPHLDAVLAAGRDDAADAAALAAAGREWAADAPDAGVFRELAGIKQRPLLVAREVLPGWPAELHGADVLVAAVFLDGLPDPPSVN